MRGILGQSLDMWTVKAHVDGGSLMSEQQNYSGGAVALTTFASVMLMVAGAFQFFAGSRPAQGREAS